MGTDNDTVLRFLDFSLKPGNLAKYIRQNYISYTYFISGVRGMQGMLVTQCYAYGGGDNTTGHKF